MKKGIVSKLILGLIFVTTLTLTQCVQKDTPTNGSTQVASTRATNTWETKALGGFSNVLVYTPTTMSSLGSGDKQALLIVLHGCTQSYTAYKTAKLEAAATQYGMVIAVPDAMKKAGYSCWDYWGSATPQNRNSGDYANVINLAKYFTQNAGVDPNQVYLAGLSSGGAFTMNLGCMAPDIFAGVGIMAGPSVGTNSNGAFSFQGTVASTQQACQNYAGSYSSYFQTQIAVAAAGDKDTTVPQQYAPQNAQALANIYGATKLSGSNSFNKGTEYLWDVNGKHVVSQLTFTGVAHAWPGGSGASGSYIDGSNPQNFAVYLGEFFKNNNRRVPSDRIAPVASISSPSDGATVSGSVAISASATDDVAVTKVEIYLDGALKTSASSSSASYAWNATQSTNGSHTILVKAYDAAGNIGTKSISVNVTGGLVDTEAPTVSISSPSNGASVSGIVSISASASDNFGVTKVEFYVDGSLKGTVSASPYSYNWDTAGATDGSHTILVKAYDAAGNIGTSTQISVTTSQILWSEKTSATLTAHYTAGRLTVAQYNDLGLGKNTTGINPGLLKYSYITAFYLYKLKSNGSWVTDQVIPAGQR